jgi:hypothetical protein
MLHGSEVAYWSNAEDVILGALQAVPEGIANTWVAFESTANGAQGWFYNECMKALRGESEWRLHFYAWWWDAEYRIALEDGQRLSYTPEEQALVDKHHLSAEQINWRRKKQNDLQDRFQQEYPETPEAAFLLSGGGVFDILPASFYTPDEQTALDGHIYVAGVDWGDDPDSTAVSVFDVSEYREVALIRLNRMNYAEQVGHIVELCKAWRVDKAVLEYNGVGKPNAQRLADALDGVRYDNGGYPVLQTFTMTNKRKHDLVEALKNGLQEGLLLLEDSVANAELRAMQKSQTASGLCSN